MSMRSRHNTGHERELKLSTKDVLNLPGSKGEWANIGRASGRCIKTRANEHIHACNNVALFPGTSEHGQPEHG